MSEIDTIWFTDLLAAKKLSQRRLAKLLDCDPASVNRLVNGKRALRLDEAKRLAVFLGVSVGDILAHSGVNLAGDIIRLVGFIDGAGEAHIDWQSEMDTVPTMRGLPPDTVAVQYRTAMSAREMYDGWLVYVQPPDGTVDHALNRFSLVSLESGIAVIGWLKRGYRPGTYNVINVIAPVLTDVGVRWATPVLLVRP